MLEELKEENKARDQIVIQALLRVAALEKTLIAKGIIKEKELVEHLSELSEDLANVIKDESSK